MEPDSNQLADQIARRFITRKDVKAVQKILPNGDCIYMPHVRGKSDDKDYIGWSRAALVDHIEGRASYGHYLLNEDNKCKLFAFDVDLNKTGKYPYPYSLQHLEFFTLEDWTRDPETPDVTDSLEYSEREFNPRLAWHDRTHEARAWLKYQLRHLAGHLSATIHNELEIPVAAYYSGNKGIHVYGFTGLMDASDVRLAAKIVLDSMKCWSPLRGDSFYQHTQQETFLGFPNISLEVFPKQDTIGDSGNFGNLMRLPLGTNLKNPKDPTFFIDLSDTNLSQLKPVDPLFALTTDNAWGNP